MRPGDAHVQLVGPEVPEVRRVPRRCHRLEDEQVALVRLERRIAGGGPGPRAGRVDDDARLERAARGLEAAGLGAEDGRLVDDPRPGCELIEQGAGVDHAVGRHVHGRREREPRELRPAREHRGSIEHRVGHVQPPGAGRVLGRAGRVVEAEQAAGLRPRRCEAAAQELGAANRERARGVVLGHLAAQAGAAPARVAAELRLALEDHGAHAALGQRPRRRAAREPAPHDRDLGARGEIDGGGHSGLVARGTR